MAAVHIVHYTSGCHAALGIYGRALAPCPRLFVFVILQHHVSAN